MVRVTRFTQVTNHVIRMHIDDPTREEDDRTDDELRREHPTRCIQLRIILRSKVEQPITHYATRYHRLHDSIAAPEVFTLTDGDIEEFCKYLDERKFKYETETSKFFADMLKMARHEDIDSATLSKLEALEPMLTPDFRDAIERNKEEVKEMLGSEIVLRYYYQKGQAAYQIRFDDEVKQALKELH